MLTKIFARYCDLDKAARFYKAAVAAGTVGWAARWALVGMYATTLLTDTPAEAQTIATITPAPSDTLHTTIIYGAAFGAFTLLKWAGWGYGALGYAHHRTLKASGPS